MRLKPCPHCGGEAELQSNYVYKARGFFIMCKCTMCGAQGKTCFSEEDPVETEERLELPPYRNAVNAWNMRYNEGA